MDKELEEAAENYANKWYESTGELSVFTAAVSKNSFKHGATWQAERMYSEEDLKLAFEGGELFMIGGTGMGSIDKEDFADWFKQFKKK